MSFARPGTSSPDSYSYYGQIVCVGFRVSTRHKRIMSPRQGSSVSKGRPRPSEIVQEVPERRRRHGTILLVG